MAEKWVPIGEAMRATGMSRRALEARAARGSVATKLVEKRRYYDLVDLYDKGLVAAPPAVTVAEMLDRIEQQARLIGRLLAEIESLRSRLGG